MVTLDSYAICYPQIIHPLALEKEELKQKYIYLLRYYADKYCPSNQAILYRIKTLSNVLFNKNESNVSPQIEEYSAAVVTVMKTRFTPFRLFSYRYIFLFDCLFIMAVDNDKLGNDLCSELESKVNRRYHNTFEEMKNKMYAGTNDYAYNKLISDEMVEVWDNTRKYLGSKNRNITFTATMSAGKSTLINAIVGREISYAKKAACTATVMSINTSPSKGDLMNILCNEKVQMMQSEQEIRAFTKGLEKPCSICGCFLSPLTQRKITLIDTPGVNSSQNPEHKKVTCNELTGDNTDVLVYVIPVENYGSDGDFNHLTYIKKRVQYRNILFVVNMMDSCDLEDDSVDEIVANIKEHLESIGFDNPIICPMSAKAGMLIKQALYGTFLSENGRKACKTYIRTFQDEKLALAKLYPEVQKKNEMNDVSWLQVDMETIWNAFINTGLPGFETLLYAITKEE